MLTDPDLPHGPGAAPADAASAAAALADAALVEAALAGGSADDEALLDVARPGGSPSQFLRRVRRFTERFLPERLLGDGLDARRRARFVVVTAFLTLPFGVVLIQQLAVSGLTEQAAVAALVATAILTCPFVLRLTGSHVVAGAALCVLLTLNVFFQAFTDAGLHDPILHWAALVPLVAALLAGFRLALVSAALNVAGVGVLYALTLKEHPFPHLTSPAGLDLAALLSLTTATAFALVWGWIYEGYTLREGRQTNAHLGRLREALSASEARYQGLFDNAPLGLYRTSPEGDVLLVNPAMVKMLGYPSAEALRAAERGADVYADAGTRARFREQLERDGEVDEFTAVWKTRDGRHLYVREHARVVRDAEGRPLYYEGAVRDVTAQFEAQQRLRLSEERYRALVQHASDLTLVLDPHGRVAYCSPAAGGMLGRSPDALVGRPPWELAHPDDRRRLGLLARRVLGRAGAFGPVEFRMVHAGGHHLYVEAVGSNLLQNPHVRGLVLSVRDVTERKRAEAVLVRAKEQAEEVARLKSAFLANMSHEIRTPLTGILGFASILAEEVHDEQQREFVGLIEKSGRRLMETLNSVLDLARLEAGRMTLRAEPVVVAEAAADVVRLLQPLAREKGLALEVRLDTPQAQVRLDRPALDRILTNLVGNALKFTACGRVTVEVEADARAVRLHVRDTGVGIEPEFLPRLFNEFEQESSGVARSHEGSGLGLAITRQLVDRMHGAIEVESRKGEGTTFTVAFPRADAAPVAPAPAEAAPAPESPSARRVLVLDDNPNTRLLIERMLRAEFRVDAVATAQAALAAAEGAPYDAVLLDINLGGPTPGDEVMRRLRRLPSGADVPIVAFTAYALPGDAERFLHAGFDGYLPKPFTKAQLMDALTRARAARPTEAGPSGDGASRLASLAVEG